MQSKKTGNEQGSEQAEEGREEPLAALVQAINQPLAAIRINAQAALRLLNSPSPDLDEVRAALREIVEDDKRAAEGVRRLHELARQDGEG